MAYTRKDKEQTILFTSNYERGRTALLANTLAQAEYLQHCLEQAEDSLPCELRQSRVRVL